MNPLKPFHERLVICKSILLNVSIISMVIFLWLPNIISTRWLLTFLVGTAFMIIFYLDYPEIFFVFFMHAGIYKDTDIIKVLSLPSFLDLTISFEILTLIAIIFSLLRGKLVIAHPPIKMFVPYITIIIIAILSLGYSKSSIYGADKLVRLLVLTSFSLFAAFFIFQDKKRLKRYFWAVVVISFLALFETFSRGIDPFQEGFRGILNSGGDKVDYLSLAALSGQSILILIFFFYFTTSNLFLKLLIIIAGLLNIFGMLISGGRSTPIGVGVITFLMTFILCGLSFISFLNKKKVPPEFTRPLKIIGIFSTLFILVFSIFQQYYSQFLNRILTLSGDPLYYSQRDLFFASAIDVISNQPLGLGIGGFPIYIGYEDMVHGGGVYPHNLFLEVGAELGWIGLFGVIFLFIYAIISGFRSLAILQGTDYYLGLTILCQFALVLFGSQFHGDINDNRLLFLHGPEHYLGLPKSP